MYFGTDLLILFANEKYVDPFCIFLPSTMPYNGGWSWNHSVFCDFVFVFGNQCSRILDMDIRMEIICLVI